MIDVIDLPGIYSLSTFSIEEAITMNYILHEKPDVVVNVIDSSNLERNLYLTIQLLETETPLVIALNQVDMAIGKGIAPNSMSLEQSVGVPVVSMIAVRGVGFQELIQRIIDLFEGRIERSRVRLPYGEEIEQRVETIASLLSDKDIEIPARYAAIKLLEGDEQTRRQVGGIDQGILSTIAQCSKELEQIHRHSIGTIIRSERYAIAYNIAKRCQEVFPVRQRLEDRLDRLTTGGLSGYLIMAAVILSMFAVVFGTGDFLSGIMQQFLLGLEVTMKSFLGSGIPSELAWGAVEGIIAGFTLAVPYIIPFYLLLGILEDSGYLARMAFMMDNVMHFIGFHGKAFIPLILGFGCNVPGCLGCRIMETERDRIVVAFLTTLIPCAARTVVILGLVGHFVGLEWALAIYGLDIGVILLLGRLIYRALPGETTGLIIEVPSYRIPDPETVVKRTWFQTREFVFMAFPLMTIGSVVLKALQIFGLLEPMARALSPVTVGWLGLPSIVGVVLIFGVLRKELTLIMLASASGTTDFAAILTKSQMIVFAIVTMFYIPCIATIAALRRELGWRSALAITVFEISLAVFLGGIVMRLLPP